MTQTASTAQYWQHPSTLEPSVRAHVATDSLQRVANWVEKQGELDWWRSDLAINALRHVAWPGDRMSPGVDGVTAGHASQWRAEHLSHEDVLAKRMAPRNFTDRWWSSPRDAVLHRTSRQFASLPAVGLSWVEGGVELSTAVVTPVVPAQDPRIYEIHVIDDWVDLVTRYPIEATRSRGPDWSRLTGLSGRWFIPDYTWVAEDYDAVHLSVSGYLSAAGLPCPVEDGRTLLAGWSPDEAYWFSDLLTPVGPPQRFLRADDDVSWQPEP